jgi:hypothetical protein
VAVKIIFLDFDGVMNTPGFIHNSAAGYLEDPIDTPHVDALNAVVDATGARVVISSSWRLFWNPARCTAALRRKGFRGVVIGMTPRVADRGDSRGHEIQQWIDESREKVESFVILDDDSDMEHLIERLVQTDGSKGLTLADAAVAIRVLTEYPDCSLPSVSPCGNTSCPNRKECSCERNQNASGDGSLPSQLGRGLREEA